MHGHSTTAVDALKVGAESAASADKSIPWPPAAQDFEVTAQSRG